MGFNSGFKGLMLIFLVLINKLCEKIIREWKTIAVVNHRIYTGEKSEKLKRFHKQYNIYAKCALFWSTRSYRSRALLPQEYSVNLLMI